MCGVCVVIGTLLYERKGPELRLKRILLIMAPVTLVVGSIGVVVLMKIFDQDYFKDSKTVIEHAMVFGAVVASLWGLLLGVTQALDRFIPVDGN